MPTIFYIILSLIIVFGVFGIIYICYYNMMQNKIIRINEAEKNIDEDLRKRYDAIVKIEEIIKREVKVNTSQFKELNNLSSDQMSNFDFERITNKYVSLIYQIKKDYPKLDDNKDFKEYVLLLRETNEKIDASKIFYNQHTSDLNKIVRRFPSLIVARIHRINCRLYFDNKDLSDDNICDFKL